MNNWTLLTHNPFFILYLDTQVPIAFGQMDKLRNLYIDGEFVFKCPVLQKKTGYKTLSELAPIRPILNNLLPICFAHLILQITSLQEAFPKSCVPIFST